MSGAKINLFAKTFMVVLTAACITMSNADAQDADAQDDIVAKDPDARQLEEIVVTARKRDESLLDAPLAISAFNEAELGNAGFKDIVEVSKATPGLFIEKFNSLGARVTTTPRFRGIYFASGDPLHQTATVFLDGIYMSGGISTLGINELERVEIIKGPQSALFGRNTFAGAINYITKKPSNELRVEVDALAATRDEYRFAIGADGPLGGDALSFRVGGMVDSKGGHYDNIAVPGQKLGDESQWSVNGSLLFEPNNKFSLRVRASYREVDDGPPAATFGYGIAEHNYGGFLLVNDLADRNDSVVPAPRDGTRGESVYRGTIRMPAESTIGLNSGYANIETFRNLFLADPRYTSQALPARLSYNIKNVNEFGLKLDSTRLSAHAKYDFNEAVSLKLLAGHYEEAWGFWSDYDFTPDNSYMAFYAQELEDTSFEARLSGLALDGRLNWIFGASHVDTKVTSIGEAGVASFYLFPTFFPDDYSTDLFVTGARTFGIFASVDYQFTDRFSVTLEGRQQEDEIRDDQVNRGLSTPISPATLKSFVPRMTFRFKPSDTSTQYFTYSEGNLPGGFNASVARLNADQRAQLEMLAPDAGVTYDEEGLKNYELGWKQSLAGGRAAFNLATFFMKRKDEIVQSNELITDHTPGAPNPYATVYFNSNGASTNIYGLEIDASWNATDNLSLRGSFGYVHAAIDSFPKGAGTGDFGDIFGKAANVEGQRAPRFPPVLGSLGATYEAGMSPRAGFEAWYLRGDVYYTGEYWDSISNVSKVESASDVNLRFGVRGSSMRLEFFVTNLLDEDTPASANNFSDLSFAPRRLPGGLFDFSREGVQMALRDKRQFGIRVNYVFE